MKFGTYRFQKKLFSTIILLVLVPCVTLFGAFLLKDQNYMLISVLIAVFACIAFFASFEIGDHTARELTVIAAMTALSVIGRLIFAPLPGFKPITAITVITGIALGPQAGFMTGSLSAIISNIFYGQGPWTPFQMFVWGMIGFVSGVIFKRGRTPNRIALSVTGILSGIAFSLVMDVWTVLSANGEFILSAYLTCVASSVPFMITYAVSNVIFLLLLAKAFIEKLERLRKKYGIFPTFG